MEIRGAIKKDIGGVLDLQKSYGEDYWMKEDFEFAVENDLVIFLVAEEDGIVGSVIGYITPTKRTDVMLHETRVHKNQERKGIGRKLVEEFCRVARERGVEDIYAEIEKEHVSFYIKSCKFKDRGKHILVMKKIIGGSE